MVVVMSRGATSPLRRTFPVPGGPHVRLRLAGPADREAVRALLDRRGVLADDLELQRLLAFDPARHHVLAALAPINGQDALVGIGAIANGADAPDTLVVDERLTDGLGELIGLVLAERASRHHRRVA